MSTSFAQAYGEARLRRMYPSAKVALWRSPAEDSVRITVTINEKDLITYDRDETLRALARSLEPKRRRRHWSLFRRRQL